MEQTITAKTPTGTEYTATAATPLRGLRTQMRFEVEIPAKGVTFAGTYEKNQDAIMSFGKVQGFGKRVGLKATDEVRRFVEECERPIREAEAAEKARIEAIVAGMRRGAERDRSTVYSSDGLYSCHPAHESTVSISSEMTDLEDTTRGKLGRHVLYLPTAKEDEIGAGLLAGARDFHRAADVFYEREEADLREAAAKILDEKKEREEDEAFERAEETGERQLIRRYTTECNSPNEECSTDVVTVWAIPNGFRSKETTRTHTW